MSEHQFNTVFNFCSQRNFVGSSRTRAEENERKLMSVGGERAEDSREVKEKEKEGKEMKYDSTGLYHWCPGTQLDSVLLTREEAAEADLTGHVVVAVFSDPDSPALGLRNLVMPLRASNIPYSELRQVVILGSKEFIEKY